MEEHQQSGAGGATTSSGGCVVQAADSAPGSSAPKSQEHTGPQRYEQGGREPDGKYKLDKVQVT